MYQKLFTKILRDIVVMSKFLSYILVINCTLLGILVAKDSSGQSMSVNNIYLTLDMENVELQQVFSSIEEQTDFTFTYFKSNIKKKEISALKKSNTSLGEILRTISREVDVQFKRVNDNIYVNKKNSQAGAVVELSEQGFREPVLC